jgi:hypothetical protein
MFQSLTSIKLTTKQKTTGMAWRRMDLVKFDAVTLIHFNKSTNFFLEFCWISES